jgi:hypothetical protein
MLDMRKFLMCCVCSLALVASSAVAGTDGITNGGFGGSDTGWIWLPLSSAKGSATAGYYGTGGNPPGCGLLQNTGSDTNNYRYYESFTVTPGNTYYLRGQWKGDIRGIYAINGNPTETAARNWAEVHVVFSSAPLTASSPEWTAGSPIKYKKRFIRGGSMNTATGIWDWESILISPGDGAGPADGAFVVPAGMNYMTVAFNIGGVTDSVYLSAPLFSPGSSWFMVDNFHVCDAALVGDLNIDCSVNFKDTAYVANQWLTCGLDPATSCW